MASSNRSREASGVTKIREPVAHSEIYRLSALDLTAFAQMVLEQLATELEVSLQTCPHDLKEPTQAFVDILNLFSGLPRTPTSILNRAPWYLVLSG